MNQAILRFQTTVSFQEVLFQNNIFKSDGYFPPQSSIIFRSHRFRDPRSTATGLRSLIEIPAPQHVFHILSRWSIPLLEGRDQDHLSNTPVLWLQGQGQESAGFRSCFAFFSNFSSIMLSTDPRKIWGDARITSAQQLNLFIFRTVS
jgi:hypothetical protein